MSQRIVFRADASLQIGTGHVMRCLTLADALAAGGADCRFICREHQGNLIEQIRSKGYIAYALPTVESARPVELANGPSAASPEQAHSHWLGTTQEKDAEACAAILAELQPDWLVADHYALDASWELALKPHYRKLMVIDDLADRPHQCDLLLDQTFGRDGEDYRALVPANCHLLCGSQYALLRPEFSAMRGYSLQRRAQPQLRHLLIAMGGVDKDNATGQVLQALRDCHLPADCQITVVMGATAPWLSEVKRLAQSMPWPTRVMVGVSDMARLMADCDLAIGAAGTTSWERSCLGLPTIMLVLADNQRLIAHGLEKAGAAKIIDQVQDIAERLPNLVMSLADTSVSLLTMCVSAARIVDGVGVSEVIRMMEN